MHTKGKSLAALTSKGRARVTRIEAGQDLHSRLAGMGIIPGVELEMVRNDGRGPLILAVNKTRIVLGRGMAEKVMVS